MLLKVFFIKIAKPLGALREEKRKLSNYLTKLMHIASAENDLLSLLFAEDVQ
jgi:hypothetical protein